MKKLVLLIALLFAMGMQANTIKEKNDVKADVQKENLMPLWWACEQWGMQVATSEGYVVNTMAWYHEKNRLQAWCVANVAYVK